MHDTQDTETKRKRSDRYERSTSGGYCGGVPPLPIPNREVKPTCADGTAMQCGRVGGRLLSKDEAVKLQTRESDDESRLTLFSLSGGLVVWLFSYLYGWLLVLLVVLVSLFLGCLFFSCFVVW